MPAPVSWLGSCRWNSGSPLGPSPYLNSGLLRLTWTPGFGAFPLSRRHRPNLYLNIWLGSLAAAGHVLAGAASHRLRFGCLDDFELTSRGAPRARVALPISFDPVTALSPLSPASYRARPQRSSGPRCIFSQRRDLPRPRVCGKGLRCWWQNWTAGAVSVPVCDPAAPTSARSLCPVSSTGLMVASADDPRVSRRFGAHASSCLRGFRSSKRCALRSSSAPAPFVCPQWDLLCQLQLPAGVSSSRAPMLRFPRGLQRNGSSRRSSSAASTPRSSSYAHDRSRARS